MLKSIQRVYVFLIIASLFLLGGTFLRYRNTAGQSEVVTHTPTPAFAPSSAFERSGVKGEKIEESAFYQVVKVVDGDTLTVVIQGKNETLRLIGINTPETVDPRSPVECFGKEASAIATSLLTGKRVRLESDETQTDRDRYDRLLRYVFLEDGTNFNKWMITEGYAYEYTYDLPYKYQAEFKSAQEEAQAQQKGLWNPGACNTNPSQSTESLTPQNNENNFQAENSTIVEDKDCSDFSNQNEAQQFFLSQGGPMSDPHKLDSDKDGVVCESLP